MWSRASCPSRPIRHRFRRASHHPRFYLARTRPGGQFRIIFYENEELLVPFPEFPAGLELSGHGHSDRPYRRDQYCFVIEVCPGVLEGPHRFTNEVAIHPSFLVPDFPDNDSCKAVGLQGSHGGSNGRAVIDQKFIPRSNRKITSVI